MNSITAPAHPRVTGVSVYPTLLIAVLNPEERILSGEQQSLIVCLNCKKKKGKKKKQKDEKYFMKLTNFFLLKILLD